MRSNSRFLQNLKRFKLISFDVTDTIIKAKSQSTQYVDSAKIFGINNINPEKIRASFKKHFKYMNEKYPNFGRCTPAMNWEIWWKELVKKVFLSVDPSIPDFRLDPLATNLVNIFATADCWTVINDTHEMLKKLQNANKCIGVISNFDPRLKTILGDLNLLEYFNFVTVSYVIGWAKPQTQIFEKTLEEFEVEPCEALHIGNTYETDYVGAKNSGWSALLVSTKIDPGLDIKKNHTFITMRELINSLETQIVEW